MSEQAIQLLRGTFQPGQGGYQPGSVIVYRNIPRGWARPEWHESAGAVEYSGPLPANATIVDVEAELRAERAIATPPPPKPPYRLAELKKVFGWTSDEQATEGTAVLGLKGQIREEKKTLWGGEVLDRYQEWNAVEVDNAAERIKRIWPNALPANNGRR